MSECPGLTVRYDQGLRGGFREVNGHCPGCSAHGGDRLTDSERKLHDEADDYLRRGFYAMAISGGDGDLRARAIERDYLQKMLNIIDRLAPKPEVP